MSADILIVGAGPAGLACGAGILEKNPGASIRILEKNSTAGGRVASHNMKEFPFPVDNCQHILTGSCKQSLEFFKKYGGEDIFTTSEEFSIADGDITGVNNCKYPVPFNLFELYSNLAGLSFSSLKGALKILGLKYASSRYYPTAGSWLKVNQSPEVNEKFWYPLVKSILNEKPSRVALEPFKKWIFTGLLSGRQAGCLHIFREDATWLFKERVAKKLKESGVKFEYNNPVENLMPGEKKAETKEGQKFKADRVIAAVPPYVLERILPENIIKSPRFRIINKWEYVPILTVHLMLEDECELPPVNFLAGGHFEWAFHDPHHRDKRYLQLVKSAARRLERMDADDILEKAQEDISRLFPHRLKIKTGRVICEKRATISLSPLVERDRFGPETGYPNFYVAGDWTAKGWPASLESAVRSGQKVVDKI